ncbi:hypothetical protein AMK16_25390 [Streptomyces sp. CB00455]|uniref:hypothetical protein n=1 Tax=Streptomyces sp. CB00455 TaxID=1703927 RepID=UPI00093C568D|nr:hypothetical protein [Streptomyces sp. CB00455]OKK16064.1 hypothetical protein AMK16_25390 [Streptomyces sp. CB00455]
MRNTSIMAAAAAVAALLTLSVCGGGGNPAVGGVGSGADAGTGAGADGGPHEGTLENPTKNGGVNGNAPKDGTAFQKLPKAGTMAAAARFINVYTPCDPVSPADGENGPSEGPDTEFGPAFSVTERGYCGRRSVTTIVLIKDPKAFQTAFKARVDAKKDSGNPNSGIVLGQDFAMGSESSDAMSALLKPQAGLLMLNCHPDFKPPSGFRKEPALVKGCVLTDYYKD